MLVSNVIANKPMSFTGYRNVSPTFKGHFPTQASLQADTLSLQSGKINSENNSTSTLTSPTMNKMYG